MTLWDRDTSVQVVQVDRHQDRRQYILRTAVHVANIVAVAGDDEQVGRVAQRLRFTEGLDQRDDVLAFVGT